MATSNRVWKWFLMLAVVAGFGLVSACNTMEGMGEDIEKTGENIQDAADND